LLGAVTFHEYDQGWLISTGPLGKDANSLQHTWEEKPVDERSRLSIYAPERVIDLLINSGVLQPKPVSAALASAGSRISSGSGRCSSRHTACFGWYRAAQHGARTWRLWAERMARWLAATGFLSPTQDGWVYFVRGSVSVPAHRRRTGVFLGEALRAAIGEAVHRAGWLVAALKHWLRE
jgi:hypothetical protein